VLGPIATWPMIIPAVVREWIAHGVHDKIGLYVAFQANKSPLVNLLDRMVPKVGFELTTYRLQGGCSTTELFRHTGNYITTDQILALQVCNPGCTSRGGK